MPPLHSPKLILLSRFQGYVPEIEVSFLCCRKNTDVLFSSGESSRTRIELCLDGTSIRRLGITAPKVELLLQIQTPFNGFRSVSQPCRYIDGLRIISFSVTSVNIDILDNIITHMIVSTWDKMQLISCDNAILADIQRHLRRQGN